MVKAIKTEQGCRAALVRINELMDAEQGSMEGVELEKLVALVEAYEAKHHPIDPPDPIEAARFRRDQ